MGDIGRNLICANLICFNLIGATCPDLNTATSAPPTTTRPLRWLTNDLSLPRAVHHKGVTPNPVGDFSLDRLKGDRQRERGTERAVNRVNHHSRDINRLLSHAVGPGVRHFETPLKL